MTTEPAYLGLDDDQVWTLYAGDGTEAERVAVAYGRVFEPGDPIREAVTELQTWAEANGYTLVTPRYSTHEVSLWDVIEPELYYELFGDDAQDA